MKNSAGWRGWLIAVTLVGMGCVIVFQHRSARKTQEEVQVLRHQLQEAQQQLQESPRQVHVEKEQVQEVPPDNVEAERLRRDNRELLRLRNEVHLLRAQLKELQARAAQQGQAAVQRHPTAVNTTISSGRPAWLGISISDIKSFEDRIERFGANDGVLVQEIGEDSPAVSSDLNVGDVITSLDNKPVMTPEQLRAEVSNKVVGQVVSLDVLRKGVGLRVYLKTGERPQ